MIGTVVVTKMDQQGPYAIFQVDGAGFFGHARVNCIQSGEGQLSADFNPPPPREISQGVFQMLRESSMSLAAVPLGDESLSFVIENRDGF